MCILCLNFNFGKLVNKLPNIKFDFYGVNNKQPIWADDFIANISNSKIALNLSQGKPLKYYSSDRIAQLMGNGIATLVDKKTKLNKLFSNNEVIFYNSNQDLNKKLNIMIKKNNLRDKLAKKGRLKYHKKYNSTIVADFIISKTFGINKNYNW